MQKLLLSIAVLALSLAAVAAQADDNSSTPFYIGLDAGHVSVDYGSLSATPTNSGVINGTATAETLYGGYLLNEYLSVELGYHDYGSPTVQVQSGRALESCPENFSCPKLTGLSAELLGRYELVPMLDGELRVGGLDWHVGSPGSSLLPHTSGTEFIYGVGVVRHFDHGLNLDITYERSSMTTEETRIGLSYSF